MGITNTGSTNIINNESKNHSKAVIKEKIIFKYPDRFNFIMKELS
jgi:hypothetical protein